MAMRPDADRVEQTEADRLAKAIDVIIYGSDIDVDELEVSLKNGANWVVGSLAPVGNGNQSAELSDSSATISQISNLTRRA